MCPELKHVAFKAFGMAGIFQVRSTTGGSCSQFYFDDQETLTTKGYINLHLLVVKRLRQLLSHEVGMRSRVMTTKHSLRNVLA